MLKVGQATMDDMERQYPGISEQIRRIEERDLPNCPNCGAKDTAEVQCGIIGRTINLAAATTRFKLIANGPKPGSHFCNACGKYFDHTLAV